jgi:hypothetical protein
VWTVPARPRLSSRGILFVVLALGLLGLAFTAASARRWLIALPAVALGLWMADLALRDLGLRASGRRGER